MFVSYNNITYRYIERAIEIEKFLQYKLKIFYEGKTYAYSDFCGAQCETSDAVSIFLSLFHSAQIEKRVNESSDSVKLTYPTIDVFGHPIYLANNIFQVQVNNK